MKFQKCIISKLWRANQFALIPIPDINNRSLLNFMRPKIKCNIFCSSDKIFWLLKLNKIGLRTVTVIVFMIPVWF